MERVAASQAVDHTLDLQAWLAEVQQQAERQGGCLEIFDALGATPGSSARGHVRIVQGLDGVQLDRQCLLDHQVDDVLADQYVVIHDRGTPLLRKGEARLAQLMCQRILVDLPGNPAPSVLSTVNAQPMVAPDSPLSLFLSACIGAHLPISA